MYRTFDKPCAMTKHQISQKTHNIAKNTKNDSARLRQKNRGETWYHDPEEGEDEVYLNVLISD